MIHYTPKYKKFAEKIAAVACVYCVNYEIWYYLVMKSIFNVLNIIIRIIFSINMPLA